MRKLISIVIIFLLCFSSSIAQEKLTKEEAVNLGYVTPEEYDQWVKPEDMVGGL
jgi:fumarate hydratase class II